MGYVGVGVSVECCFVSVPRLVSGAHVCRSTVFFPVVQDGVLDVLSTRTVGEKRQLLLHCG